MAKFPEDIDSPDVSESPTWHALPASLYEEIMQRLYGNTAGRATIVRKLVEIPRGRWMDLVDMHGAPAMDWRSWEPIVLMLAYGRPASYILNRIAQEEARINKAFDTPKLSGEDYVDSALKFMQEVIDGHHDVDDKTRAHISTEYVKLVRGPKRAITDTRGAATIVVNTGVPCAE